MHARLALRSFVAGVLAVALAYGLAFLPPGAARWAPWIMAAGIALTMASAMALGASRPGRPLGALGWVFAGAFVLILGGFWLALGLTPAGGGEPLWLGLPRRAAILVYGIGLLPVFLLPVAYAMTFDAVTLSDEDLARFRRAIAELKSRGVA